MLARTVVVTISMMLVSGTAVAKPPPEKRFGSWTVGAMPDGEGAFAATMNDSGGVLGLYCYKAEEKCVWLITNNIGCEDESTYPALVNSDEGAFSTNIVCLKNGDNPRYAFHDYDSIEKAVRGSKWLGIAFPMASGKFTVSRYPLDGAKEAVDLLHRLMKAVIENARGTQDQTF